MTKWVHVDELDDMKIVLRLLVKFKYEGNGIYYFLSDRRYVSVNFDKKTFHLGCRYPRLLKEDEIIDLKELVNILTSN